MRESGAGTIARDVLVVLAAHAGKLKGHKPGIAWPSIETIAKALGVSTKSVVKGLRELHAAGIVKITPRNRRLRQSNLYELAVAGEPFQVNTPFPRKSSERRVPVIGHKTRGSDADPGPNQLNPVRENRFSSSCENGDVNRPIEPTNGTSSTPFGRTAGLAALGDMADEHKETRPSAGGNIRSFGDLYAEVIERKRQARVDPKP